MPDKTMIDYTNKIKSYLRSAEVVEGKNFAYSQENNAVIATIENGKSYKVRWTGSATITLKKDSASGTEVTSGSTSPLSFTADSDFDLYFGSSADVTEIMVYDGASTDDTYEPYYVPVKDRVDELTEKSTKRIVTPTVDGSIAKSFEATQTLVEYDLLTRVCTFAFCVKIGTMLYNSANKFMFGFPKPKITAIWFLAACASSGEKKPVGCIIRRVNSEGQFNFSQIDSGTFATDDLIYCSGSYIIDDSITS